MTSPVLIGIIFVVTLIGTGFAHAGAGPYVGIESTSSSPKPIATECKLCLNDTSCCKAHLLDTSDYTFQCSADKYDITFGRLGREQLWFKFWTTSDPQTLTSGTVEIPVNHSHYYGGGFPNLGFYGTSHISATGMSYNGLFGIPQNFFISLPQYSTVMNATEVEIAFGQYFTSNLCFTKSVHLPGIGELCNSNPTGGPYLQYQLRAEPAYSGPCSEAAIADSINLDENLRYWSLELTISTPSETDSKITQTVTMCSNTMVWDSGQQQHAFAYATLQTTADPMVNFDFRTQVSVSCDTCYCPYGSECGYDSCGQTKCGSGCGDHHHCVNNMCVRDCQRLCYGSCGPDGCGGFCGSCPYPETCYQGGDWPVCVNVSGPAPQKQQSPSDSADSNHYLYLMIAIASVCVLGSTIIVYCICKNRRKRAQQQYVPMT